MFDTLLIIIYLVLTSFISYLITLSLSINIKRFCLFFHLLPILTDFLKFRPPPPPRPPHLLNLTKISDITPLSLPSPRFIRHLRVLTTNQGK